MPRKLGSPDYMQSAEQISRISRRLKADLGHPRPVERDAICEVLHGIASKLIAWAAPPESKPKK